MKWEMHPPLEVSESGRRVTGPVWTFLHAHLWISARLQSWHTDVDGHLHLVTRLDGVDTPDVRWEVLDLGAHPLILSGAGDGLPPDTTGLLERLMDELAIPLFRVRSLGIISTPGESIEALRSRVLGMLQPQVRELRKQSAGDAASPRRGSERALASVLAAINGDIEEICLRPLSRYVISGEAGLLVMTPATWRASTRGLVAGVSGS